MLKTGQDAGRGLKLVSTEGAMKEVLTDAYSSSTKKNKAQLKVVQRYISTPFLIRGRKFHLRCWLLVTSHHPLRAYIHSNGLVLFASEVYRPEDICNRKSATAFPDGHVTNYAKNEDGLVWSFNMLKSYIGPDTWSRIWQNIALHCANCMHAALPSLRAAHQWLRPSIKYYGFQMVGADFLLDDTLKPWLLEFNSAPSIMARHKDKSVARMIYDEKIGMLTDMIGLLAYRWQPEFRYAASHAKPQCHKGAAQEQLFYSKENGQASLTSAMADSDYAASQEIKNLGAFSPLLKYSIAAT